MVLLAAEQGNVGAQIQVSSHYAAQLGVERDYKQSHKWMEKAARQGDAVAQAILASNYYAGLGVEKDKRKGDEWYNKAIQNGYKEE